MLNWRLGSLIAFALTMLPTYLSSQILARHIDTDNAGHHLRMTSYAETSPSSIKQATVVFESGLGGGEDHWKSVIEQLPKGVSAITYERPGMSGSEPDGVPPSPEHIATVLHAALSHVASPPYVLVGHSWGGPLVRAFAGLFPKVVCGLVLVDPTDFGETQRREGATSNLWDTAKMGNSSVRSWMPITHSRQVISVLRSKRRLGCLARAQG